MRDPKERAELVNNSSKNRNALLKYFTENEYSHDATLKIVAPMEHKTDSEKEEMSVKILEQIQGLTESEAILALRVNQSEEVKQER